MGCCRLFALGLDPSRLEARRSGLIEVSYRYCVGDRVLFYPSPLLSKFAGSYLIERQLPVGDAGPSYLIKHAKDGHLRTASERELAPIPREPLQSKRPTETRSRRQQR
jgi:hypothetical protein